MGLPHGGTDGEGEAAGEAGGGGESAAVATHLIHCDLLDIPTFCQRQRALLRKVTRASEIEISAWTGDAATGDAASERAKERDAARTRIGLRLY
jgi:hypothetical protein